MAQMSPRAWSLPFSVVLAGCTATLAGCAAAGRAPREPESRVIRVLVYNIHAGKDAKGVDNLERVGALVRETGADIALLQEVDRGTRRSGNVDQVARFAELTGLHTAFGKTLDYDGGKYGIAILSRWPFVADTLIHLPIEPPQLRSGVSYEPRGAHRVVIAMPGTRLTVINTHLDASREDNYRRQEARTIAALVASARAAGEQVLTGGDFNSEPASEVQVQLRGAGLRDAWTECGRGPELTYPADSAVKRIDYLFLTASMRCNTGEVLANQSSDHRAVLFTIAIPRG
jgi:endonuclease/exonuclease/phosphatase family metal-dependent hydrolase